MRTATFMLMMGAALLACAAAGQQALRTGRITGRVLDLHTRAPLPYANVAIIGTSLGAMSLETGRFEIAGVPAGTYTVKAMRMGYRSAEKHGVVVHPDSTVHVVFELDTTFVASTRVIEVQGERSCADVTESDVRSLAVDDILSVDALRVRGGREIHVRGGRGGRVRGGTRGETQVKCVPAAPGIRRMSAPFNTESYDHIVDNEFLDVIDNPVSTFSVDVDAASYSNFRRFVHGGVLPPPDAVRVEEFINYFSYDYPEPEGDHPFSITTEIADCPWNDANKLVHIGLQGKRVPVADLPPGNLVFLLDVSGSMRPPNKLPLLKAAFRLLVDNLRAQDRVAIVVYAGAAGRVLPSTPGDEKATILDAIGRLHAGGTTAGAAGIQLAYGIAQENYLENGNNRVILATDGDFNVGVSSDGALVRLIEEKRESGISLTVLGFGEGNLKDSKMEKLADKGNGHYAYIDNILEARKVLISELGATLLTIAKDVKIQIEFNPAKVEAYRLVGYENRLLRKEDFDDDTKDAGEVGAGHSVTALYEIVPAGGEEIAASKFKYVNVSVSPNAYDSADILTVRFRYKPPDSDTSRLITQTVTDIGASFEAASVDFRFAAAVAEFAMLLRGSRFKGESSYEHVRHTATSAMGDDPEGYRAEFVRLVSVSSALAGK